MTHAHQPSQRPSKPMILRATVRLQEGHRRTRLTGLAPAFFFALIAAGSFGPEIRAQEAADAISAGTTRAAQAGFGESSVTVAPLAPALRPAADDSAPLASGATPLPSLTVPNATATLTSASGQVRAAPRPAARQSAIPTLDAALVDATYTACRKALAPLQRRIPFKRWSAEASDPAVFTKLAAAAMGPCEGRRIVVEDRSIAPISSDADLEKLMGLTKARATAVKDALVALGVPPRQIVPHPRGRSFKTRLSSAQRTSEVLLIPTDQRL